MQIYNSINEMIKDNEGLSCPGRIYFEKNKKSNYRESKFWVLSSGEIKNQDIIETEDGLIPEALIDFNVSPFIDVASFQDIVENVLEHNDVNCDDNELFIKAIHHYLEEDDFLF